MAAWLFGVPAALFMLLYVVLLVTPIPLPFVNQQVRSIVLASMPEGSQLELGDMALTLEKFAWPVIQFKPVTFTDATTGGRVRMDALEVGFSPLRALIGQPGATVTIVGPHIQVNQDLFGPRLATFEFVDDPAGGPQTVRVIEGRDAFPEVNFAPEGVALQGELPASGMAMRSDNDWLIYNLEGAEKGIAGIVEQARLGNFSRLVVRDGTLDMNDALYGVFRTFHDINVDIAADRDGAGAGGTFSAEFGGTVMNGNVERVNDGAGTARLIASITNLDLSSVIPFIDDRDSMASIVGPSAVSLDVAFDSPSGKIRDATFHVDMTGTDLRIEDDYFPLATSIAEVRWDPKLGQFSMGEMQVNVAGSSGWIDEGVFRLGFDQNYGPTVSMSMKGRDISILADGVAPEAPFASMSFSGWSAPLYGATGVDHFVARKADGAQITSQGRIDALRKGIGFDMTIGAQGVTADDLKRLWPYFISAEGRDWFVKNITGGTIRTATMNFAFPPGTVPKPGVEAPLPTDSVSIDMTAEGVMLKPIETMAPIAVQGETRLTMKDGDLVVAAPGAEIATAAGPISIANFGFVLGADTPGETLYEFSGDVSGNIPAIVALAQEQQPEALAPDKIPFDLGALGGNLSLGLVATIVMPNGSETPKSIDYAVTGSVQDFGSTAPLQGHTIGNGLLNFTASPLGYRVTGQAAVDGLDANVVIEGKLEENAPPPDMLLSARLDASDFKKLGFDASQFLTGAVEFVAKPMADGSIQLAVDLADAGISIKDLGISKAVGTPGTAKVAVKQTGTLAEISAIDVAFGGVRIEGSASFDAKTGLQSAAFTNFALSEGDSAQLSLTPIRDGFQVKLRGDQLDLKPMFQRFFSLSGESTGGPQATAFKQTIVVDAELKRALGFFRTTAFNVDLSLALRGSDLQNVNLQANLGGDRAVSVATNATPDGRVMSVAFNDLGTVLRLLGVYPNVEGGAGSLVFDTNTAQKVSTGTFTMKNFAFVNEDAVAQILGNHNESKQMIARGNKLAFRSGEVDFIMRKDRVEITDAVLAGDTVGGSARGFIYTDQRQYDLVGTYVPLFGLNNAFARLLGPLAGRNGEGLLGITFAVRGPLDKPDFKVNPLSALAPGAFRRMFEYRAKEIPRVE